MKKASVICIVGLVLLVVLVLFTLFGVGSRTTRDISYYQALTGEVEGEAALWIYPCGSHVECPYDLPRLSELGDYQNLRFVHNAKRIGVFSHHSYVLVAEYEGREYEAQKRAMEERYTWCTEENEAFLEGDMTEFQYTMDDFLIRAVDGGWYPHEMLFVGCSDSRQEIAIVYYYDQDLDYIDDSLGKFIDENTGWSKVVR